MEDNLEEYGRAAVDKEIEEYLATKELNLTATTDGASAYKDAEYIIIATPTNYDPDKNYFDTSSIEKVIELVLETNPNAVMIIKSTIPVGYTKAIKEKYHTDNIIFSPAAIGEGLFITPRSVSGAARKLVNDGYLYKEGKAPVSYGITQAGCQVLSERESN